MTIDGVIFAAILGCTGSKSERAKSVIIKRGEGRELRNIYLTNCKVGYGV